MGFNKKDLDYLVCPVTKQPLSYDHKNQVLVSATGTRSYQIIGNTVMLFDDHLTQNDDIVPPNPSRARD